MSVLNLGCGNRPLKDATNHDRLKHRPEVAVAWDLNRLPWPWKDGEFDGIHAISVLEHLDIDLLASVNECWRILKPGGTLKCRVPYWRHETCWRDPTHRRGYTMETFDIFDVTTNIGKPTAYGFYTDRKWKITHREYIYMAADLTSIASSLEVVMEKIP